jgi:cell wall-associated NlpC family hydrolase
MAAAPDGGGYWLAAADGGVFTFGDAEFYGSAVPDHLPGAIGQVVGIAATSDGRGYWLASSTGGVYSFGDAKFWGSASRSDLADIVAIAAVPAGGGYWLVSSSGGVYCFGDATYHGSLSGADSPVVGFAATPDARGYWLATASGDVISYGDAEAFGPAAGAGSPAPFIGIAAAQVGSGYWAANSQGSAYGHGSVVGTGASDLAGNAVAIVADPAAVELAAPVPAPPGARVRSSYVPDSAGEKVAHFALSQVGKPYVYGAAGPYSYDCSGLAMVSWRAVGVRLPRTAAEQYYAGTHVPVKKALPGDLVFWASDPEDPATIYHVAISLGGDRTVQAPETGETVKVMHLRAYGLVPLATRP